MKILLGIIKVLGVLFLAILLLILILIVGSFNQFEPITQAYKIENAVFESTTFNELATREEISDGTATRPQYPVSYHSIKSGSGTVLAVRFYHDPSSAFDDEGFWKLTVWLPDFKEKTYDLFKDDSVIVFYTKGGSAWPRSMCASRLTSGTMKITDKEISINSSMDCWSKSEQINGQWEFEPYDIEDLDYWVGKKGAEHPYHETIIEAHR